MKILSITTSLLGDYAASWRIRNIAERLQAKGHDVHLVQFVRKFSRKHLTVNREIENLRRLTSWFPLPCLDPLIHLRLLRLVRKEKPDLIYANGVWAAFVSIIAKTATKTSFIFDMHGLLIEEFLLYHPHPCRRFYSFHWCWILLYKLIEFVIFRFSDNIIGVSPKMIDYLHEQKGVPLTRLRCITNGVDLQAFQPAERKDDATIQQLKNNLGLQDKLIFGYAGGLQKWQGLEDFLMAARKITDDNVAFIIVGGETSRREGNIVFLPRVSRHELRDYYLLADVLVLPRFSHPATQVAAPTKFAEYAAVGKPVLVTDVGWAADLVRRYDCGIVVRNDDPEDIAQGIRQFRSKTQAELQIMGERSRKLAENEFDWDKLIDDLHKILEEIA